MASFTEEFRYACHVLPLHALKPILQCGSLLSKSALAKNGSRIRRSSTADVDEALGFADFVHFYLPRLTVRDFTILPILDTQLRASATPPFPHVALAVDTGTLEDKECAICNFNIAASRPSYDGVRGGNHSRGTSPEKIRNHWQKFKNSNPQQRKLRGGRWVTGCCVPILYGADIAKDPAAIGRCAPKLKRRNGSAIQTPELLLTSPFLLDGRGFDLVVFSEHDNASVGRLADPSICIDVDSDAFQWYSQKDRVDPGVRRAINEFFESDDTDVPDLDFDRHRPRL